MARITTLPDSAFAALNLVDAELKRQADAKYSAPQLELLTAIRAYVAGTNVNAERALDQVEARCKRELQVFNSAGQRVKDGTSLINARLDAMLQTCAAEFNERATRHARNKETHAVRDVTEGDIQAFIRDVPRVVGLRDFTAPPRTVPGGYGTGKRR